MATKTKKKFKDTKVGKIVKKATKAITPKTVGVGVALVKASTPALKTAGNRIANVATNAYNTLRASTGRMPVGYNSQTASVGSFNKGTVKPASIYSKDTAKQMNRDAVKAQLQKDLFGSDKGIREYSQKYGYLNSSVDPSPKNYSTDRYTTEERNQLGAGDPLNRGNTIEPIVVSGEEETIDEFGRSTGMGGQPVAGFTTQSKGGASTTTTPTPEFAKGGVSNYGAVGAGGGAVGAGIGAGAEGGTRQLGIAGTQIEDPVLKSLLEQYGKDAQLDVNLDDIREKNRRNAQAEIDAINSVYSDLVGRAERVGQENLGAERAMQARSGTLASSFGQGAMQTQRAETEKNIGEIENQRTVAIQDVYANSENRAMQEFQSLQSLRSSGIEGYLQAMEMQKENLDKGLDEVAQYTALQGLSGDDLGIEGLQKIAKDWNTTPMAVYNRIAEKRSAIDNAVIERSKAMGEAGVGTDGGFDQFSKESIAFSVLPTQLRNSDAEREYYQNGIRQGLEQGLDPYQIADVLMGYQVTNPDELSDNIRQIIGQSELTPARIAEVARNLNAGNKSGALSIVENSVMARAKKENENYISESAVKTAMERSDALVNKINSLPKSPIGVTSGTMEKWLGKLRGKESSKIMTDIVRQVAQMRKEFSGSAVTPSEERFLAPIIPDLADKPDVFMYKLEQLGADPLQRLNNIRTQYNLIQLNRASLLDKNIRVKDYYNASLGGNGQTATMSGGGDIWIW